MLQAIAPVSRFEDIREMLLPLSVSLLNGVPFNNVSVIERFRFVDLLCILVCSLFSPIFGPIGVLA